MIFRNSIW